MKVDNRRLSNRVNVCVPIRFRPINTPAGPVEHAESLNVSERGVYFATTFPLKVGTPVELYMQMPRELTGRAPTEMRCKARVVHVESDASLNGKNGVGLYIEQFESVQGQDRWAS